MQTTGRERLAGVALDSAQRFLRRWSDGFTSNARDDLAQDAACAAWLQVDRVRDRTRFPALVRTISRRLRGRAIHRRAREAASTVSWSELAHGDTPAESHHRCVRICGMPVPWSWLLAELDDVLSCITALNRCLLIGFHEGFSCTELAQRFELSEACVKVRLHRSRKRIRKEFEARVARTDPASWCGVRSDPSID